MQQFFSLCPCYYDNLWHIWCDIAVIANNINNILYLESDLLVLFVDRWYMMIPYTVPWLVSQVWGNMFGLNPSSLAQGLSSEVKAGRTDFKEKIIERAKNRKGGELGCLMQILKKWLEFVWHWTALSIQKIHEVSPTGFDFCNAWTFTKSAT